MRIFEGVDLRWATHHADGFTTKRGGRGRGVIPIFFAEKIVHNSASFIFKSKEI